VIDVKQFLQLRGIEFVVLLKDVQVCWNRSCVWLHLLGNFPCKLLSRFGNCRADFVLQRIIYLNAYTVWHISAL
jgi:hypothetical protein